MPWTLYRFIFKELLKTLVLSTVALVAVMAVGSAAKPLSEGLLEPMEMVRLILLLVPGMLTYALPFSAAFSVTLVYYRLAAENEITACAASGISYRSLLLPVIVLALILSVSLVWLTNYTIPRFWQKAGLLLEQDVARMMINSLNRNQPVKATGLVLYADSINDGVIPQAPEGMPQPHQRLVLDGVAVARLEPGTDRVIEDYTTERAVIDFYRMENRSFFVMRLSNFLINQPERGAIVQAGGQPFEAIEIPSPFQQKMKFMTLDQLLALRETPTGEVDVARARYGLVHALIGDATIRTVRQSLRIDSATGGVLHLVDESGRPVTVEAPVIIELGSDRLELRSDAGEMVRIEVEDANGVTRIHEAESAQLWPGRTAVGQTPRLSIEMNRVTIRDPRLGVVGQAQLNAKRLGGLQLNMPIEPNIHAMDIQTLQSHAEAELTEAVAPQLERFKEKLGEMYVDLHNTISERLGMCVMVIAAMLLGGILTMKLRAQGPLPIFFWSFIPTLVAVIMLFGGSDLAEPGQYVVATTVSWSGIVILMILSGVVYHRLARN